MQKKNIPLQRKAPNLPSLFYVRNDYSPEKHFLIANFGEAHYHVYFESRIYSSYKNIVKLLSKEKSWFDSKGELIL